MPILLIPRSVATGVQFIQQATGQSGAAATSTAVTFGATPTAGHLLVLAMAGDKAQTVTTPSGWTDLYNLSSTSVTLYFAYKVSAGTETTVTVSHTSSVAGNMMWVGQYNDPALTGSWSVVSSASHITDELNATSWATGTTGTLAFGGLSIAVAAVDTSSNAATSSWSNSYAARYVGDTGSGRGGIFVAEKTEAASGTASSTFTLSPGDQTTAAIAVFRESSGLSGNLSQPSETDTSQAIARQKVRAVGQPTETDAGQAITRRKSRTLGQPAETDTVTAVARSKARAAAQAVETDVAQPIGRRKLRAVGQATAANTAQAFTRTHIRTLGQPAETDTANAAGRVSSTIAGQPAETDAAQALSRRKSRTLGQAAETDAPLAITRQGTFGQPLETDVAQPIGRRKLRTVGQPAETDAPQALTRSKRRTTGQPSETDTATVTARRKARVAAQAVETDLANPVIALGKVRQAVETDLAQPITRIKRHAVAQAVETEAGQAFTRRHARTIGQPSEVDACQALARRKSRTPGQATETDAAQPITVPVVFMAGSVGASTLTAPAPTVGAGIGVRASTVGPNPPVGVPSVKGQ